MKKKTGWRDSTETIWNGLLSEIKKILEFPTFDVQWKIKQLYSTLSEESYMPRAQPFFEY